MTRSMLLSASIGAAALLFSKGYIAINSMFQVMRVLLMIFALTIGLLYHKQDSLLYVTTAPGLPHATNENPLGYRSPKEHNMPFEDVYIKVARDDVDDAKSALKSHGRPDDELSTTLHAWFIKSGDGSDASVASSPTLIYFHGNAGNVGLRMPYLRDMWANTNVNVLAVDYRGYGLSNGGPPSELGLVIDAFATLRWLRDNPLVDPESIFVFGRSLGGAVGTVLASSVQEDEPLRGLILENTFTSLPDVACELIPLLRPFKFVLNSPTFARSQWRTEQRISSVACPVMFISGGRDTLVSPLHMEVLRDALEEANKDAEFAFFPTGGHNDTPKADPVRYYRELNAFIDRALGGD